MRMRSASGPGIEVTITGGSFRTWRWLRSQNPQGDYQRKELPGYAHLDAIVGSRAAIDVYPFIAQFLDRP